MRLAPRQFAVVAAAVVFAACTESPSRGAPPVVERSTTSISVDDARIAAARGATLRIRSTNSCEGVGVGSGFMVAGRRLVTNRHVVQGASEVSVEAWDGAPVDADISGQGRWADLALLTLSADAGKVLKLASSDPPVGTKVHVFGYPSGRELTIADGKVLGYETDVRLGLGRVMKIDAHIEPGNSGGPVVDNKGRVVGVVYAIKTSTKEGLAVPVSTLRDVTTDASALTPVEKCEGFFRG